MVRNKMVYWAVTASLLTAGLSVQAMAAERIEDITMEIESGIYAGGYGDGDDIEVIVDTEGCYVDTVEVTNEPDDDVWEEGDKPKAKIVLRTEDGYTFASGLGEDEVSLYDEDGTVTSVSRSSSKLTISVTLTELDEDGYYEEDEDYTLDVADALWDSALGGLACWEGNDYAKRYEVQLFRDDEEIASELTTEQCRYDFSRYFTESGEYVFRVRAVRSSSNTGSWEESNTRSVSAEEAAQIRSQSNTGSGEGYTIVDPAGAWMWQPDAGWWWCNPNRSYPCSVWAMIKGQWYYFNEQGYCVTNDWVWTNGKWYYCEESGAMATSRMIDNTYYVNANGEWVQ